MSSGTNGLNERKKLILKAIVDAHIANGEPVGSKFLTQNKQIACSSATIPIVSIRGNFPRGANLNAETHRDRRGSCRV